MEKVAWEDVQVFISRLNDKEFHAGRLINGWRYVLPTEAEWEYACRPDLKQSFHGATKLKNGRRFDNGHDINQTQQVGLYSPNFWVL